MEVRRSTLFFDLGQNVNIGGVSHKVSPELVRAVLNAYLKALGSGSLSFARNSSSSFEETEEDFPEIVFIAPDVAETEGEIEEQVSLEEGNKPSGKTTEQKASFIFIRVALGEVSKELLSKSSISSSENQNSHEIKKQKPSSKEDVSFSTLKGAFEKLSREKPELSSEILEITNWFEKQLEDVPREGKAKSSEPSLKLVIKEVRTSLQGMKKEELISLAKSQMKEHPALGLKVFEESLKQMSKKEIFEQFSALKKEHPMLAIACAKKLGKEESFLLKQLIHPLPTPLETAVVAAASLKGGERAEELLKLIQLFKTRNPQLALESAKALFGKKAAESLVDLTLFFAKERPDLALKSAEAVRGKDRIEVLSQIVKIVYKQYPILAMQIAQIVLPQIRMLPDPMRTQLLILFTPPLDIKEIKGAVNPFAAQSGSLNISGISSSKSRKKNEEEQEEEQKGTALFTFYTQGPFEADLIQKIEKPLLLEGILVSIQEIKDYHLLLKTLEEEKMGSLFFQQIRLLKEPFVPLVFFYIEPIGLYSESWTSFEDLRKTSKIAIPKESDARERALLFLKGLNLENAVLIEEDSSLIDQIEKVDAVVLSSLDAWRYGFLSRALAIESKYSPYGIALAVNSKDIQDKDFLFLKKCLESEEMRSYLEISYQGVLVPLF